jgi:hypothetical protein
MSEQRLLVFLVLIIVLAEFFMCLFEIYQLFLASLMITHKDIYDFRAIKLYLVRNTFEDVSSFV